MPDPESLHAQILQTCSEVDDFVRGMSHEQFMGDLKTQRGVAMTFVIIAVADRIRLEQPDLLASLPSIPWAQIRGMRNRLVHGYIAINLETVWATASIAIPQLRKALKAPQSGS